VGFAIMLEVVVTIAVVIIDLRLQPQHQHLLLLQVTMMMQQSVIEVALLHLRIQFQKDNWPLTPHFYHKQNKLQQPLLLEILVKLVY